MIAVLLALPARGVLLPPALVHVGGLDVHTAAGTSSWCFLFTGVVGTPAHARTGHVQWSDVRRLTCGVAPGAPARRALGTQRIVSAGLAGRR